MQNVSNKISKIGLVVIMILINLFIITKYSSKPLEWIQWIPYDRFYDIKYIAKGGFGKVYRAIWIDGHIDKWDEEDENWRRKNKDGFVALKSLNNSKNVTLEFMNEV